MILEANVCYVHRDIYLHFYINGIVSFMILFHNLPFYHALSCKYGFYISKCRSTYSSKRPHGDPCRCTRIDTQIVSIFSAVISVSRSQVFVLVLFVICQEGHIPRMIVVIFLQYLYIPYHLIGIALYVGVGEG